MNGKQVRTKLGDHPAMDASRGARPTFGCEAAVAHDKGRYRYSCEQYLEDWLDKSPVELGAERAGVRERHRKDNSKAELDRLLKEEAAPANAQLVGQRPFYDSPVKVLSRTTLGDPKRTEYLEQLQYAGHAELGHMAQVAVSTRNVALAAAVLTLVDRLPAKEAHQALTC